MVERELHALLACLALCSVSVCCRHRQFLQCDVVCRHQPWRCAGMPHGRAREAQARLSAAGVQAAAGCSRRLQVRAMGTLAKALQLSHTHMPWCTVGLPAPKCAGHGISSCAGNGWHKQQCNSPTPSLCSVRVHPTTHSQGGLLSCRADEELHQACQADAEALCQGVKHGGGQVQACLVSRRDGGLGGQEVPGWCAGSSCRPAWVRASPVLPQCVVLVNSGCVCHAPHPSQKQHLVPVYARAEAAAGQAVTGLQPAAVPQGIRGCG